jgi:hypothetical protein
MAYDALLAGVYALLLQTTLRREDVRNIDARLIDIIANNPIDQKVVELSSSQPYSLVELSMYRSVFPP